MKYLRRMNKQWYYERAVPTKIKQAVGKTQIKVPLGLSVGTSDSKLAAAIAEIDEEFQAWFDLVAANNADQLSEKKRHLAGLAYLKQKGLSVGDLAPLQVGTASERKGHEEYISSQQDAFDLGNIQHKLDSNLPLTGQEQVVEYAWTLATEPQRLRTPLTFQDAWNFYAKAKNVDDSNRFWNRFIDEVGNQAFTTDNIYEAQRHYANFCLDKKLKPQTIKRELSPVLAAFRAYASEHRLKEAVHLYKIVHEEVVEERSAITIKELFDLWQLVTTDTTLRADARLALLLMIQSSLISSEVQRLKLDDLILPTHPDYEGVSWVRVVEGKTKDRTRPVPLVAGVELIQQLVNQVALEGYVLGHLSKCTNNAVAVALNSIVKRINPKLTTYSLRHGWLDRGYNADVPESFQDRVGGWTGSIKSKKRGYARLADTSIERLKVYEGHQRRVNRCLLVDRSAKVVELNSA